MLTTSQEQTNVIVFSGLTPPPFYFSHRFLKTFTFFDPARHNVLAWVDASAQLPMFFTAYVKSGTRSFRGNIVFSSYRNTLYANEDLIQVELHSGLSSRLELHLPLPLLSEAGWSATTTALVLLFIIACALWRDIRADRMMTYSIDNDEIGRAHV